MGLLHRLYNWFKADHRDWLITDDPDPEYSNLDHNDGRRHVAWADQLPHHNPSQRPGDIHIVHNGDAGYNYWFEDPDTGLLAGGTGFRTEGKAWRAALAEQENIRSNQ